MHNGIDNQKEIAKRVLEKLEAADPYCILAGGAPRDWHLGKEAVDLDFYFFANKRSIRATMFQLSRAGLKVHQVKSGKNLPKNYKLNPYLHCVFEVEEEMPVQIMLMQEPTFHSVVPTFALNMCQAWWKGADVKLTKDFEIGLKHKCIYKTNELYHNEHFYLEKILNKFPEYTYYESRLKFFESLA